MTTPRKDVALILGVGGQDGSYLAEHLLHSGFEVHGLYRRTSTGNLERLSPETKKLLTLWGGDLTDTESVMNIIRRVNPEEIYNLADQDDVRCSFHSPGYSYDVTGAAVGRLLQALDNEGLPRKFFQAISATIFGSTSKGDESSPICPASPYACAKAFAYHLCHYYRQQRGLFVSTAVLFNHDSPRRGEGYLLQKICRHIAKVEEIPALRVEFRKEKQPPLLLTDPDFLVDIGPAKEYVKMFPDLLGDFCCNVVIGNEIKLSVKELAETAYYAYPYTHSYSFEETFRFEPSGTEQPPLLSRTDKAKFRGLPTAFSHSGLIREILETLIEEGEAE